MNKTILIFVLLLFCVYSTTDAQVLFPYNSTTELYDSCNGNRCIGSITEDESTDTYYEFTILEKKRKMIYVDICAPDFDNVDSCHMYSCKISRRAWVRVADTKIYGKARECEGRTFAFYKKPKYEAKTIAFDLKDIGDEFQVIDICGLWLKVQFIYEGKKIRLWLSPESQCSSIFNECT